MRTLGIIFALGIFLIGMGCGEEAPKPTKLSIPAPGPKPAAKAPAKEPSRPVMEAKVGPPPSIAFTYDPQGKVNPFQPLVVDKPEKPEKPEMAARKKAVKGDEPRTPLEKLDLQALKLVAVIWNISVPRAMVEDPGGKGYILTMGTRIGRNQGQVTKITPAGVVVTEKYETSDGKMKTRDVPLLLYTD
jgi:type IV pilus assembly protein PilP